ncbi:LOW QUALITY PROTEIN: neuropeptide B [Scyliorhinus torazame]|uniref:LOW QUALITY PROTEIN: neuropeptide B n=1 Tax=Scyliorhinus torazame TaxID=75743 RepID=UPI003B5C034A
MPALGGCLRLARAVCASLCPAAPAPPPPGTSRLPGPSYYSVGRASGLLSGIRRSPYTRRSEPGPGAEAAENSVYPEPGAQPRATLIKKQALCVKDISPNLQSCELLQDGLNTFQCKADVFLSLDSQDCVSA